MHHAAQPSKPRLAAFLTLPVHLTGVLLATLAGSRVRCAASAAGFVASLVPALAEAGPAEVAEICQKSKTETNDACEALASVCASHAVDPWHCDNIAEACVWTWKFEGKPDAPALCEGLQTACNETPGALLCEDAQATCYCALWDGGSRPYRCEEVQS